MTDPKRLEEFLRLIQKLTEPEQRALLRLMRRMDLYETLLGAIPVSAEKIQDLIQKYTQQGDWDSVLLLLWKSRLINEADVGSASSKS
jgi:hypothetical protein